MPLIAGVLEGLIVGMVAVVGFAMKQRHDKHRRETQLMKCEIDDDDFVAEGPCESTSEEQSLHDPHSLMQQTGARHNVSASQEIRPAADDKIQQKVLNGRLQKDSPEESASLHEELPPRRTSTVKFQREPGEELAHARRDHQSSSASNKRISISFGDALAELRKRAQKVAAPTAAGRVATALSNSDLTAALLEGRDAADSSGKEAWQRRESCANPPSADLEGPRAEELKRSVLRLLNRVCPENIATIVEHLADIQASSNGEVAFIIKCIFQRALLDPHYGETYADLIFGLHAAWGNSSIGDESGEGHKTSFRVLLVETCQTEFQALPLTFEPTLEELGQLDAEDLEMKMKRKKDRMLAFMRLVGHLFLRRLLTSTAVGAMLVDLLNMDSVGCELPGEHEIECGCELLTSVGAACEADEAAPNTINQVCARLLALKASKGESRGSIYSKRLQFKIQDLIDLRQAGWTKRSFKAAAKTKEEIRNDAESEQKLKEHGEDGVLVVVAGERPQTIAGIKVQWGDDVSASISSPQSKEVMSPRWHREPAAPAIKGGPKDSAPQQQPDTRPWRAAALPGGKSTPSQSDRQPQQAQIDKEKEKPTAELAGERSNSSKGSIVVALPPGGALKAIGRRGKAIATVQEDTKTRIWVDKVNEKAHIHGTAAGIEAAKARIADLVQTTAQTPTATRACVPCKFFMQGRCLQGKACTFVHEANAGAVVSDTEETRASGSAGFASDSEF